MRYGSQGPEFDDDTPVIHALMAAILVAIVTVMVASAGF